jgi:NAD-dependent SIR2 family protein deacetylase
VNEHAIAEAAEVIRAADALVIAAGAGMGVDSGLPDFRGRDGFWRAYPKLAALRLDFESIATPGWFDEDPELAWGFYGHRLELYRRTRPHAGFSLLLEIARGKAHGAFVLTSNVDGQFQRAGFEPERVLEVHGTIHECQCIERCGAGLFPAPGTVEIDERELRARPPLPSCPRCGRLARPNILMFDDLDWDDRRTAAQRERFHRWLETASRGRLVVVELGAGKAVSTVRNASESLVRRAGARLVRINPRDSEVSAGQIAIAQGALSAIEALAGQLTKR